MGKWIKKVQESPLDVLSKVINSLSGNSAVNAPSIGAVNRGLNTKSDVGHSHAISDVTNLQTSLDGKAASNHTHPISDINDIEITSAKDNDLLKFDSVTGKWVNGSASDVALTDRSFNALSRYWKENSDASTSTDYPYMAVLGITPPWDPDLVNYPVYQNENDYAHWDFILEQAEEEGFDLTNKKYMLYVDKTRSQGDQYYTNTAYIYAYDDNDLVAQNITGTGSFKIILPVIDDKVTEMWVRFFTDDNDEIVTSIEPLWEGTVSPATQGQTYYSSYISTPRNHLGASIISNHDILDETGDLAVESDANIPKGIYKSTSRPIWQMSGAGTLPTGSERENIDMILEAVFDEDGITLYATDEPSVDLELQVKGD